MPYVGRTSSHPFKAKHAGDCALCADPIKVGDLIRRVGETYVHYRHVPNQRST